MKYILPITAIILIFGCKKTPLNEASETFWGTWTHYTNKVDAHTIYIFEDGTGYMTFTDNNKEGNPTKTRDWYLEDNELFFGKVAFNGQSYEVDKYPTVTFTEIINFNDTVPEGKRYMILDENYYVEQ